MYKQRGNNIIVNRREVRTRAHDAVLFLTKKTNSENYKKNVFYKGALAWNSLSVQIQKSQTYTVLKDILNPIDPNPAISGHAVFPQSGHIRPEKRPFF